MSRRKGVSEYQLSDKMKEVLFHAECGDEGYTTKYNHDMPSDRYLDYQSPLVIKALVRRRLIKKTGIADFPWKLSQLGRRVARLIVVETLKKEFEEVL